MADASVKQLNNENAAFECKPEDILIMEPCDHHIITDKILEVCGSQKSFLFAGAGLASLPLSIPVSVAIQLARSGKRCLLMDMDFDRDAIAKVFEIKPSEGIFRPRPSKTSVEGLLVWPAYNFSKSNPVDIRKLICAAETKFDLILVNAPYFKNSMDRTQIAAAISSGFIFTSSDEENSVLQEILEISDCDIISNIQVITPTRKHLSA